MSGLAYLSRRKLLALLATTSTAAPLLGSERAWGDAASLQGLTGALAPLPQATIYVAREIITMDPALPRAEAVAVVGGRIAAVGSRDALVARTGDQPFRIDETFVDKVMVAGFVEQHVHPTFPKWPAA